MPFKPSVGPLRLGGEPARLFSSSVATLDFNRPGNSRTPPSQSVPSHGRSSHAHSPRISPNRPNITNGPFGFSPPPPRSPPPPSSVRGPFSSPGSSRSSLPPRQSSSGHHSRPRSEAFDRPANRFSSPSSRSSFAFPSNRDDLQTGKFPSRLSGRFSAPQPTAQPFKPAFQLQPLAPAPASLTASGSSSSFSGHKEGRPKTTKLRQASTIEELEVLQKKLDRHLKNEEIPDELFVRAIIPPGNAPTEPIEMSSVRAREDVLELITPTEEEVGSKKEKTGGDFVLVRIGTTFGAPPPGEEADVKAYSIVKFQSISSPSSTANSSSTSSKPKQNSIGSNSGLRNSGIEKELLVSWVSSPNDISHKVAQARSYITDAYRTTIEFGPKKKRGGKDPKPPKEVMEAMLEEVAKSLGDVAERWKEDRVDVGMNRGWVYLEPNQATKRHVLQAEKQKEAERQAKEAEVQAKRKEKAEQAREQARLVEEERERNRKWVEDLAR
ncbi:hypothetical protein [Phaffia rhodozyma]|uniref:Uncharacterized protein n=1 Tax=Phaffia rhodozyma TaxID=264483 RepID=A0A0F7SXM4_PHARH|nr:hypothetical protein [Phaffia rhodozyma]